METEFNRNAEITSRVRWNKDKMIGSKPAAPDEERLVDPNEAPGRGTTPGLGDVQRGDRQ